MSSQGFGNSRSVPSRPIKAKGGGRHRAPASAAPSPKRGRAPRSKTSLGEKILSSKPAIVIIVLAVALGAFALWDTVTHWERAYTGVYVNDVDVSGMNREEMQRTLAGAYGPKVAQGSVTIYATDEDRASGEAARAAAQAALESEEVAEGDFEADISHWVADAPSLKATVPYDQAIDEALALGRGEGGFFERLKLSADPRHVPLAVSFDYDALEGLATQIDEAAGDARKDATITIQNAYATAVEGHDGTMVDRQWLAEQLSAALMQGTDGVLVANLTHAPSRISLEQAERTAEAVNHALGCDALFTYKGRSYQASDVDLGEWTQVATVPDGNGFKLEPSIDPEAAIPAIADGAQAHVTAEDTVLTFQKDAAGITVHTAGDGKLPDIAPSVTALNDDLYGPSGIAWTDEEPHTLAFEIGVTAIPGTMTFDEALELGVIEVIGEYTTEFSNYMGTENRNHNIKLAADLLNDSIVEGDGGIWSFNDTSGDTNEEAGFWSAGSIVNGEITDSIGGGICQVATTVFNAVYEAGLDIPTRYNHTLYMANYPDGRDAAVTYPELDLVWKNTLESDVLLKMSYTDTSVTATLYGLYTGYTVESDVGLWEEGEKYTTRFKVDDTLASGAYYLKSSGSDGSKISVTRTVKDQDGKTIDFDTFQSVYDAKDEIYVVGPDTDTEPLKRTVEPDDDSEVSDDAA